jgi:hypothetical protein
MIKLLYISIILIILTLMGKTWANPPIEGYLEARKNVNGNKPIYIDASGPPILYGLDFEFRIPVVESTILPIKLMAGAEAYGFRSGFGSVVGRAGVFTVLPWFRNMEIGYFHKSEHSLEHENHNTDRRFFSSDWLSIRYNFGNQHR